MLLALIMSIIFETMHKALGLDPFNFASTAKYSYVSCKRLMNMNMQTIPNTTVFNAILEMKRAGFSMIRKEVSLACPLNDHTEGCQYSPDCATCGPFVKLIESQQVLDTLKDETHKVIEHCKVKLKETLGGLKEQNQEQEIERDEKVLEAVENLKKNYKHIKTKEFEVSAEFSTPSEMMIYVLQSCIIYLDENNQYGNALKQIMSVGNYTWINTTSDGDHVDLSTLEKILATQANKLREDKKARVVDFYTCVVIELSVDCSKADLQRKEEFNLFAHNQVLQVCNFTEKMLRYKMSEYKLKDGTYKCVSLYNKLMSGTVPMKRYWIHSSILNMPVKNG